MQRGKNRACRPRGRLRGARPGKGRPPGRQDAKTPRRQGAEEGFGVGFGETQRLDDARPLSPNVAVRPTVSAHNCCLRHTPCQPRRTFRGGRFRSRSECWQRCRIRSCWRYSPWVRLFFVMALDFRENDNTAKTPRRQGAEEIFVVVAEALMLGHRCRKGSAPSPIRATSYRLQTTDHHDGKDPHPSALTVRS